MRLRTGLVCVLLIVTACSAPSRPEPAAPSSTNTTATSVADGPIRGALPDGTIYDVILEPPAHEVVTEVSAGMVASTQLVEMSFRRGDDRPAGWHDHIYRTREGDWTVDLDLGSAASEVRVAVEEAVRLSTHLGLPIVELSPPFSWAGDDRIPMQVTYETFAVRRGCPETAVACNPTHAVGMLPLREAPSDAPDRTTEEATVVSYALRRPTDPHYLDPGPLAGRDGHDLLWTGEEMIVWGGTAPLRLEGAVFQPATGEWRMLSPAPLEDDQVTRAVWADGRMIVVSEAATVAYDPDDDSWARLGEGTEPPLEPGRVVWTGSELVIWSDEAVRAFRPEDGVWVDLPSPGPAGVLRVEDGRLYAVGSADCVARSVTEWTGEQWREVAAFPEMDSCPLPRQVAVVDEEIVTWRDDGHLTYVHSDGDWEEADPVPLQAVDEPSGPVLLGDRLLVPRRQEGALFDPSTRSWTPVDLPGHGREENTVWTGEEVLRWGRCCYEPDDVDAWRWTPPG